MRDFGVALNLDMGILGDVGFRGWTCWLIFAIFIGMYVWTYSFWSEGIMLVASHIPLSSHVASQRLAFAGFLEVSLIRGL